MLTRKWHTSVHLWELDTPLEQLILLGQMASLKYKTKILALSYECFYMTLQKIGHAKSICTPMHTTHNLFQNSIFLLTILFSIHDLEYLVTSDLNLIRNTSKHCIFKYCSQLPEHSHYDKTDLNPFFYRTFSNPIPHWFLAVETAMLQIYSTVFEYTFKKLTQQPILRKPTTKVNHSLLVPLFLNAISHTYISLTNSNRFGLVLKKNLDRLSDVTLELLARDGSTLHVHRNHLIPYYPKEPLLYPHLRSFMRFSDSTHFTIPKPKKNMQIVTLLLLIPMNPCQTKSHHHNFLHLPKTPITILHPLPPMTTHLSNYMSTHLSKR